MYLNIRHDKSAYRCASAPQGRTCHISRINTCTYRDPAGSLSFGPRRNDRAEWTTTRHIHLTLSISSPMFFPFSGRQAPILSCRCPFSSRKKPSLQPCTVHFSQLAVFLNFVSAGVFLPGHSSISLIPLICGKALHLARETTRPCTGVSFG